MLQMFLVRNVLYLLLICSGMAQVAGIIEEWIDVGLRHLLGMPKPCCMGTLFSISQSSTT